jgi:IclR family acetate operon transcriptional repressor
MARSASSAIDKALDLIEAVARSEQPRRLVDLADEVGMHRATAYRVLVDLVRRGWVLRYGDRYMPGTVVLQLSRAAASSSLVTLSHPVLADLARRTDMMTNLQVLEPDGSRILDVVRPPRYALLAELTGELLPVERFAGPLALIAALDDVRAEHYFTLAAAAGYPLDGPEGLHADIAAARQNGYAVVRRRSQDVIASVSQVVQARAGLPLCAVAVVGLDSEFDDDALARVVAELADAVAILQQSLTDPPPGSHDLHDLHATNGDDSD